MSDVLAVDIGGSSLRAALVDDTGALVDLASTADVSVVDRESRSEIDPEAWWRALQDTAGILGQRHSKAFDAVAAIAICGLTRTQVFLDDQGHPLCPAMSWKDTRATADISRHAKSLERLGHPENAHFGPYHPAARLLWLRQHEADRFDRLAAVVEPKDYLNYRLTGAMASDAISQARLVASAVPRNGVSLLDHLGLGTRFLPTWKKPSDIVGTVSPNAPPPFDRLAGKPVVNGCHDTYAAVLGLGALRAGCAYNISGTTEVLGLFGPRPAEAEGLVSVDWQGYHQLGGPSQNGADVLRWLLPTLGMDATTPEAVSRALTALDTESRSLSPLLFLPYLQGERVPFWDPDLRGAFIGLNRHHTPGDMLRATLEGVAFLNRIVLERAETAFGITADEIRFGGGAARSSTWASIKADILKRPVVVGAAEEPGILGAALLALTATGRFPSLETAQRAVTTAAAIHHPDSEKSEYFDRLYAAFLEAHAANRSVSRHLVRLSRNG